MWPHLAVCTTSIAFEIVVYFGVACDKRRLRWATLGGTHAIGNRFRVRLRAPGMG